MEEKMSIGTLHNLQVGDSFLLNMPDVGSESLTLSLFSTA